MHISAIVLGALAATHQVVADRLTVIKIYNNVPTAYTGFWHNNHGQTFSLPSMGSGCWNPGVPGVTDFCFDPLNNRAHFMAFGQKRCLRPEAAIGVYSCHYHYKGNDAIGCHVSFDKWKEVGC
ncbi:hypothetical protein QBC34DRAFT_386861 [Podospora aff. communis PSN243]|uniref:Uncharacterized protein n=1 Tax=Podospora aff. communis PSN243 TaxID=3040156 RepID=A0AAV9G3P2_9PEZI|nr:hypothetical protein QBC34DRAFT_386861 [Podospora aff. communis PSN243]